MGLGGQGDGVEEKRTKCKQRNIPTLKYFLEDSIVVRFTIMQLPQPYLNKRKVFVDSERVVFQIMIFTLLMMGTVSYYGQWWTQLTQQVG